MGHDREYIGALCGRVNDRPSAAHVPADALTERPGSDTMQDA
jgi:hypothetical protein